VIAVAALTSLGFDASSISPTTVSFAGASPTHWALEDVDKDGDLDLILHFRTQETDIPADAAQACLRGKTTASTDIQGCDSVRIVPPEADADQDSFSVGLPRVFGDDVEASVATDQLNGCPRSSDEDAWPPDMNRDKRVDALDAELFRAHLPSELGDAAYDARFDLQFDSRVDVSDVLVLRPFLGQTCAQVPSDVDGDGTSNADDIDDDNDAFVDSDEIYIGTDWLDCCPDNPSDDAWPPDINMDTSANILDVLLYKRKLIGSYDRRYDLDASGAVNAVDVLPYKEWLGNSCTNP